MTTTNIAVHVPEISARPNLSVLELSCIVWENVVSRGWIDAKVKNRMSSFTTSPIVTAKYVRTNVDLFSVAEAMFPLVPLVCKRVIGICHSHNKSTYCALSGAAAAGSASCVAWMIHHRPPHRRCCVYKDVNAVLFGLASAGHVEMARRWLGDDPTGCGTLMSLWDGRHNIAEWGQADVSSVIGEGNSDSIRREVLNNIRTGSWWMDVLNVASGCGYVDFVKWVLHVLSIGRDVAYWALWEPLILAMIECRMEVVSWLFDEFDLVSTLPSRNHTILGACCGWGQIPADIQLGVQWGIQKLLYKGLAFETLTSVMMNKHGTVELCQWLIDEYGMKLSDVSLGMLKRTKNLEIVRWVLESSSIPIEGVPIKHFCKAFGDVAFTAWLTKERHIPLTHEAFIAACSTQRDLAKWISARVSLSQSDLIHSLQHSLRWCNTEVADWLEETFHLMAVINSDPDLAGSTLVGICWKYKSIKLGNHLTGLRWYVQHLSRPFKIPDRFIHVAITTAVQTHRAAVLFLVEVFTEFTRDPSPISPWLLENIFVAATKTNMTTLQRLTSTFGDSFTTELAAKCLTSSRFVAHSSKIVKWVISHFHLTSDHVKMNANMLLCKLLSNRKNRCAEWLINTFGFTLDDIIQMSGLHAADFHLDFWSWKMILNKYPQISQDTVQCHLVELATASPHNVQLATDKFGLTLDQNSSPNRAVTQWWRGIDPDS